ncbi:reverse transcriptase domain-containing protein [Salinibacter ruber]|uniref:reverse transcriptase domain-containing protein n=1 Tax=Salinibacter ruber TaxID=146919 RepID=UPI000E582AF4|nr:reverse transcriptase domain-containing protein [Salinibacter ruber]
MKDDVRRNFLSEENFMLAWRRILTSSHGSVKKGIYFEKLGSGIKNNIKVLSDKIENKTYNPEKPAKKYIPKRDGTLRAITVLSVEDRLVYQAMANLIAKKSWTDLKLLANKSTFGNIPNVDKNKYALRHWKPQFKKFKKSFKDSVEGGKRWIVEADVSSYYRSIDHRVLRRVLEDYIDCGEFIDLFLRCIRRWSTHEGDSRLSSGIPQGYEASDFVSTIYLLGLDKKLLKIYSYIRYVDDIRICCKNRDGARGALAKLDRELKKLSLTTQTKKTSIRRVSDFGNEERKIDKDLSRIDKQIEDGNDKSDELKERFFEAKAKINDDKREAETELKFTINRLNKDSTVRNVVIQLLDEMPWISETIARYLSKFEGDPKVIGILKEEVNNHRVYVKYITDCLRALSSVAESNEYKDICRKWIVQSDKWPLRLAAVNSLRGDTQVPILFSDALGDEPNHLVRQSMLVALIRQGAQEKNRGQVTKWISTALDDEAVSVKLLGVWLYNQYPSVQLEELNLQSPLGSYERLIPEIDESSATTPCYLRRQLKERYGVNIEGRVSFKNFFTDYDGAVKKMNRAMSSFGVNPDGYVAYINSLNHQIAIELGERVGVSVPKDQFSNFISSGDFRSEFPAVHAGFLKCNEVRRKAPNIHPIEKGSGEWTSEVSFKERDRVKKYLKSSYQEFTDRVVDFQS